MKTKSLLIGICVGVGAMLALAAGESSNPVGRYQVASGGTAFVIVDTMTGQAWGTVVDNSFTHPAQWPNPFFQAK